MVNAIVQLLQLQMFVIVQLVTIGITQTCNAVSSLISNWINFNFKINFQMQLKPTKWAVQIIMHLIINVFQHLVFHALALYASEYPSELTIKIKIKTKSFLVVRQLNSGMAQDVVIIQKLLILKKNKKIMFLQEPKLSGGVYCTSTYQCQSYNGLTCVSNYCS